MEGNIDVSFKKIIVKELFSKMSLSRYKNDYQKNMHFIGLGVNRDTKINPSTQFQFKKKRKCAE